MADPNTTYIPQTLGFDQRWLPTLQLLQQQQQTPNAVQTVPISGPRPYPKNPLDPNDPNYDPVLDPHNAQYNPNDSRLVGGVSPYILAHGAPPLSGPQQSYANVSTLRGSGDGQSGQALRQASNYNNSPYSLLHDHPQSGVPASNPLPGIMPDSPQGTISNTGQPAGPPQAGSQGELTGQGGQGWNIYQTTPTWTGSPLSQSPPSRDEGDFFRAPSLTGPENPLIQRQAAIRQALLQQAMQNIPRGYRFKLG